MKNNINEEVSRIKDMMKKFNVGHNSLKNNQLKEGGGIDRVERNMTPYTHFKTSDELLKSISGRLITAIQLEQWGLVEEIASDVLSFLRKNDDLVDASSLESSVMDDDHDERLERNYGVEDDDRPLRDEF
jgi:hypothetical protein